MPYEIDPESLAEDPANDAAVTVDMTGAATESPSGLIGFPTRQEQAPGIQADEEVSEVGPEQVQATQIALIEENIRKSDEREATILAERMRKIDEDIARSERIELEKKDRDAKAEGDIINNPWEVARSNKYSF